MRFSTEGEYFIGGRLSRKRTARPGTTASDFSLAKRCVRGHDMTPGTKITVNMHICQVQEHCRTGAASGLRPIRRSRWLLTRSRRRTLRGPCFKRIGGSLTDASRRRRRCFDARSARRYRRLATRGGRCLTCRRAAHKAGSCAHRSSTLSSPRPRACPASGQRPASCSTACSAAARRKRARARSAVPSAERRHRPAQPAEDRRGAARRAGRDRGERGRAPAAAPRQRPLSRAGRGRNRRRLLVFFLANHHWIARSLPVGAKRWVSGKLELWDGHLQMVHPDRILDAEGLRQNAAGRAGLSA